MKMKTTSLRLPDEVHSALKKKFKGRNISDMIRSEMVKLLDEDAGLMNAICTCCLCENPKRYPIEKIYCTAPLIDEKNKTESIFLICQDCVKKVLEFEDKNLVGETDDEYLGIMSLVKLLLPTNSLEGGGNAEVYYDLCKFLPTKFKVIGTLVVSNVINPPELLECFHKVNELKEQVEKGGI